jgi:predicted CoA-substrate-specific enzyme activase
MLGPGILGVDIGSVSISAALLSPAARVVALEYRFHKGKVRESLRELIQSIGPARIQGIGCTSAALPLLLNAQPFDPQVSLIAACRLFFPDARSIISIGGERFSLIRFDENGAYRGAKTNTSCAAGTGSFLDQQARRLGLAGIAELVDRAMASTGTPARISTRCAVFARTDLVHAQQEGYSLEEICDGLCRGLAQNIADTLLGGEAAAAPVVCAGGVSRNTAVIRHLEAILGTRILTHKDSPVFAAIGAALCRIEQAGLSAPTALDADQLLPAEAESRHYYYEPLDVSVEDAGQRPAEEKRLFSEGQFASVHHVEVELYSAGMHGALAVLMGIDIGSTSTKAIITDAGGEPIAGFYARTLGSPIPAVQALCAAIDDVGARRGVSFRFLGVAATGAGRKLVGAVVNADLVVDEISAHARAAYQLDPRIDTIIEIGGQDAKFTTMRDGVVTFSHMNTVCAAGTGTFVEEQAERLGCSLSEYEGRVRGARAPLSSDRCAVFMERDINNFLSHGFSTEEILAAVLFSVRENYLQKVARGAAIGNRIAFQGATARNRALVEAFRQGLGKPILVSRYCHLTGALGAALLLRDQGCGESRFVGFAALREEIPVRTEICALCGNHCRLRIATVAGHTAAYGMLCGRDYDVGHFVQGNKSGFDLLRERRKAFDLMPGAGTAPRGEGPVIGIPAALGLYGQLPLWQSFFSLLGVRTVTSEGVEGAIEKGREIQGAEFCAPLAALHGHVKELSGKADWIFLPLLLEEGRPQGSAPLMHCYYTQYSGALVSGSLGPDLRSRCLMPRTSWTMDVEVTTRELHEALVRAGFAALSRGEVQRAFAQATAGFEEGIKRLQLRFKEVTAESPEPCVVLLGRAYNVLPPDMSKGIPGMFGALGVPTFFQDMVPYGRRDVQRIRPLLDSVHWLNAARILDVACVVADTPGLYPVYITSFKCSPDSFALEYFKRILDEKQKPYLILQLDDHDSTLGYETRIEAGVASFRNHLRRAAGTPRHGQPTTLPERPAGRPALPDGSPRGISLPVVPSVLSRLGDRTLLYPSWDPMLGALLVANLRREGVDARLLEEDQLLIRRAMRHNTGQCLPVSIIAEEAVDYVRRHDLDPSRMALWLPTSDLACNLGMFTPFLKSLMEAEGGGMERIEVYAGNMYHLEFSLRATLNTYRAYLAAGLLRRAGCRLRPYETEKGAADRAIQKSMELLIPAFEGRTSKDAAMIAAAAELATVACEGERRPRVAIFGDLYVRDNDIMNQGLLRAIEDAGGEAITTPYADYIDIVAEPYFSHLRVLGRPLKAVADKSLWRLGRAVGARFRTIFQQFLDPEVRIAEGENEAFIKEFGLRMELNGESLENLVKIYHLARAHPELALFVQASPGFCCPSMVTEAMARDIERLTGVPVVSVTYDGTGQYRNETIVPYVKYAGARSRSMPFTAPGTVRA